MNTGDWSGTQVVPICPVEECVWDSNPVMSTGPKQLETPPS